jgi:hypothetical protein
MCHPASVPHTVQKPAPVGSDAPHPEQGGPAVEGDVAGAAGVGAAGTRVGAGGTGVGAAGAAGAGLGSSGTGGAVPGAVAAGAAPGIGATPSLSGVPHLAHATQAAFSIGAWHFGQRPGTNGSTEPQ